MKSFQYTFEAIGTKWVIDCYQVPKSVSKDGLFENLSDYIEQYDKTYSRFRDDSLVTLIAQKKGTYEFPDNAAELITLYQNLFKLSDGLFTPLVGSVLEEAGYDASYSLVQRKVNNPLKFDKTINYRHPFLTAKEPALLDFGAAGKGHLVDLVSEILLLSGIKSFCVDAGGDMRHFSDSDIPIKVGLEHPENPKQVIGVAEVLNFSICASSGNRRTWGEYHHIINPDTLKSPKDILSIWVTADTTILADAIATCLFMVPAKNLLAHYSFEYFILFPDYTFEKSSGLIAELFLT